MLRIMRPPRRMIVVLLLVLIAAPTTADAAGDPDVAALQVALSSRRLYTGPIDGLAGRATTAAVGTFQARTGLTADGRLTAPTRAAFGTWAAYRLGKRPLTVGSAGWDVAELQFLLAWRGFPSSTFTGRFDAHVAAAVRAFQTWAGLSPTGSVAIDTVAALQQQPILPRLALTLPVAAQFGDVFGPRGARFHTGVDLPAPAGTPVAAAAPGRVTYAGWLPGGWGYDVTVDHGNGYRSMYTHLSKVEVAVGALVATGIRVGRVGATGDATGPHVHFELRLRGAAVDPLPAFAPTFR